MGWVFLILAIVLEVTGTITMKFSHGFTRLLPTLVMFVMYGLSLTALTFAVKRIDLSLSYAIWAGVGTALVTAAGILWFQEPLNTSKLVSLALIIAGVVGLKLA
ncbi:small multidrug resistance pump [Melghirimyces thermohalophilus]|uniref:Small multidrug resistance pump n=1 Tax=Melghirimyces thermohalophilus TaxID=1236220 RepID=A0A1G6KKV2_9BACL|nr:multidrug efflux SMR transporter [Melghirimyces thermohalophilus]SDC31593.1 small multidrug resistance pump [Melghirimyces thermohalophilus]